MLRNNYINKYREHNKLKGDSKFTDDDLYILNQNRPLNEKLINNLPPVNLKKFVDDILMNKKITSLMYFTNADKEIKIIKKETNFMKLNKVKLQRKSTATVNFKSPLDIVRMREKKETISKIAEEAHKMKEARFEEKKKLESKCEKFAFKNRNIEKRNEKRLKEQVHSSRIQSFSKIFTSLKSRLHRHTEEDNLTTENRKVTLPDVKLDIEDVYSRLYHNAVLCTSKQNYNKSVCNTETNEPAAQVSTKPTNQLYVKNVLDWTNGKEFTVRVTDDILVKCLHSHSGGPQIKIGRIKTSDNPKHKHKECNFDLLTIKDEKGDSLIHISVAENYEELVEYLLKKGVDPNVRNKDGNTPLHLAIVAENKAIIMTLLQHHAYVNIPNKKKETALDLASVRIY